MLKSRVIPVLLIHKNGLVKTFKFEGKKYIGDPINTVKIFNELEVDEIVICDIDSSVHCNEPNYPLIKKIANECNMPICYAGGIKNVDQVDKIIGFGVEKVGISSGAFTHKNLIRDSVQRVGSQSVSFIGDIKPKGFSRNYGFFTHNGKKPQKADLQSTITEMLDQGVGEIVINFISREGTKSGYDIKFIQRLKQWIHVPLTVNGGAGDFNHIKSLIGSVGLVGAGASSIFVFQGKFNAVLISYPSKLEKETL
ncbi:HisA/HisF-related TIM barrel protein [Verrucomicrobia bacterium]|nr:HisA/HisF-related TIM barrel protein [Verrucomicrobiota bacterium]